MSDETLSVSKIIINKYFGAGAQTRTADLLITNQLLYQLSYTGKGGEYKGNSFAVTTGSQ